MTKRKTHRHEIKAFAAFSTRGQILYATIKPTKEDAQATFDSFNPEIDQGYFEVLPIFIGVDKGFQYKLETN